MNKNNAKDFLPLVQALAEGKTIQRKGSGSEAWSDVENTDFAFPVSYYRIKPEPRRIWVNEYECGVTYAYASLTEAEREATKDAKRIAVEYVEVI